MRLSSIYEAMSRRDFFRQSGGTVLRVLMAGGLSVKEAESIAASIGDNESRQFGVYSFIQDSSDAFYEPAQNSMKKMWAGMVKFGNRYNAKPDIIYGPDQIGTGFTCDEVGIATFIIKAKEQGWEIVDEGAGHFYLTHKTTRGPDEMWISPDPFSSGDYSHTEVDSFEDFVKNWWDGWMSHSGEPSSPKFRSMLKDYGVDVWDRPDYVIEQWVEQFEDELSNCMTEQDLQRVISDFEENYGELSGLVRAADANGVTYSDQLRELAGGITPPNDYKVASPMHQWMESILNTLAVG